MVVSFGKWGVLRILIRIELGWNFGIFPWYCNFDGIFEGLMICTGIQ